MIHVSAFPSRLPDLTLAARLDTFFYAAHAIADLYAHFSLCALCGLNRRNEHTAPRPGQSHARRAPDYGPGGDFDLASRQVYS